MTRMVVRVKRYARWGLHSATWRAAADYADARDSTAHIAVPAPRFGDESVAVESGKDAGVIARRGNVLVSVVIIGPLDTYYRDGMYAVMRPVVNALHAA